MMQRYTLFALFLLALLPLKAQAETNIAVVDVRYILTKCDACKSISEQRSVIQKKFLDDISKTEQALRQEEQALIKERETLTSEAFLKKKQDYERKLLQTGRSAREKKQGLDNMITKSMADLKGKLTEIVQEIATDKNFNLVITKQNVIIGSASIDITQEALDGLNKALPTIKLKKQ